MIDLIVPTRGRPDLLYGLRASLIRQDVAMDVILWNNEPDDPETEIIADGSGWNIATAGHNLSFSESLNRAAKFGSNEWIVFLNNDARPDPHALDRLVECTRPEPIVGTLNYEIGHIGKASVVVNHAGINFVPDSPVPGHVGRGEPVGQWASRPCATWPATTFACVKVKRSVWEEIGGLNEDYWYGFEDVDFCMRAAELGYGTGVCYEAKVHHGEFGTRTREHDESNLNIFLGEWVFSGRASTALQKIMPPRT